MEHFVTLYHGSEQIIEEPTFGKGKANNDFGQGFYCTENEDLAKEWAVSSLRSGFVNRYTLDTVSFVWKEHFWRLLDATSQGGTYQP